MIGGSVISWHFPQMNVTVNYWYVYIGSGNGFAPNYKGGLIKLSWRHGWAIISQFYVDVIIYRRPDSDVGSANLCLRNTLHADDDFKNIFDLWTCVASMSYSLLFIIISDNDLVPN